VCVTSNSTTSSTNATIKTTVTCKACASGYYLRANNTCGSCATAADFCEVCNATDDTPICLLCEVGYFLSGRNVCDECATIDPHCNLCSLVNNNTIPQCLKCTGPLVLFNNTCIFGVTIDAQRMLAVLVQSLLVILVILM